MDEQQKFNLENRCVCVCVNVHTGVCGPDISIDNMFIYLFIYLFEK